MTIAPQSTDKRFLGVILPAPMAAELKSTATARGTSASELVRAALDSYLKSGKSGGIAIDAQVSG